jgi:hypothetical protein
MIWLPETTEEESTTEESSTELLIKIGNMVSQKPRGGVQMVSIIMEK